MDSSSVSGHVVLFPFMSKGHTIPILHLARLLVNRNFTVTIFTTQSNHPFILNSLSDLIKNGVSIVDLPFPENIEGVPSGIESTDKLPHISLWLPLARATHLMRPYFEQALETIFPPASFMVTDGFLSWTVYSANKYGIPRLFYYGMSSFASTISRVVVESGLLQKTESDDELFAVPNFSWIKITRDDFGEPFNQREPKGPLSEFVTDCAISASMSFGQIINSFYELESVYLDYWNNRCEQKLWSVGPLCLAEPPRATTTLTAREYETKSTWIDKWLERKLDEGKAVLYVAFGSQAEISPEQFQEIKIGLEKSGVNFLWVVRKNESELNDGFEERIKDRGLIVKEWVEQREILGHQTVQGFLSHCGWNSVLESICAKVPILAWPMMAEQPLNAKFVAEEVKIALRVKTCNGSVKGFVKSEDLEKGVRELMEGASGKEVRKKVIEVGEAAVRAVKEGGSSCKVMNQLLDELHAKRHVLHHKQHN